ncbi:hypothetical protein FB45DRAFT_858849 [Roridomyces roridus]|uniref:F-box domain-containing protein n=1 Tax=Roridomyces roridus TaxID=1738132 RepID=A0AAD7CIA9_9AGAR|nr:hypothetical protein FB45DRAFT_858849 [Roridomyces roridus]
MSTQAIEAQLAQVSHEIQRQKDVLKKLESSRSLLQQQLNAVRDPIARLPLEISSDIFLQCLPLRSRDYPREYPRPKPHLAPLLFLNVCHAWTDIAASTPALWVSIGIFFPRERGFEQFLKTWLRRTGSRPLQISLRGVFDSVIARPIQHHSAQLESLVISFDKTDDLVDEYYDFLGGAQPQVELPRLRTLEIRCVGGVKCFWLSFHRLLRLAPNITEIFLQNISFRDNIIQEEPETLVLPRLRHLTHSEDDFDGMNWVSTPGLETLCVSTEALFTESFISFLHQASPPLRTLELCGSSDEDSFTEPMALMPNLTCFECLLPEPSFVEALLNFLARNPHLVPNLETLQLDEIIGATSYTDMLTALAGVLSVRRSRLKTVCFTIYRWDDPPSLTDDLTFFRELLEEGMNIHISLEDRPNMLCSS